MNCLYELQRLFFKFLMLSAVSNIAYSSDTRFQIIEQKCHNDLNFNQRTLLNEFGLVANVPDFLKENVQNPNVKIDSFDCYLNPECMSWPDKFFYDQGCPNVTVVRSCVDDSVDPSAYLAIHNFSVTLYPRFFKLDFDEQLAELYKIAFSFKMHDMQYLGFMEQKIKELIDDEKISPDERSSRIERAKKAQEHYELFCNQRANVLVVLELYKINSGKVVGYKKNHRLNWRNACQYYIDNPDQGDQTDYLNNLGAILCQIESEQKKSNLEEWQKNIVIAKPSELEYETAREVQDLPYCQDGIFDDIPLGCNWRTYLQSELHCKGQKRPRDL